MTAYDGHIVRDVTRRAANAIGGYGETRDARACPEHSPPGGRCNRKTWMAATSPAMMKERSARPDDCSGVIRHCSAVIPPPLFRCEPHGFGAVAAAPIHPAPDQALFALRAGHREDARKILLNLRSPRIGNLPLRRRSLLRQKVGDADDAQQSTRPAMICAVSMLATPFADRAVSLPPRAFALTNDREIAGPTDIDDGRAALRTGSISAQRLSRNPASRKARHVCQTGDASWQ